MSPFTIYPAIDLRNGRVVRLVQGNPLKERVYSLEPGATANHWLQAGARWLHVVDLDGALDGAEDANLARSADRPNRYALEEIVRTSSTRKAPASVQFGGGLRSAPQIRSVFALGVSRVVLGTAVLESPELLGEALSLFGPGRVAVAIDVRHGQVRVHGWRCATGVEPLEFARAVAAIGVRLAVYTNISRDGLQRGIDIEACRCISEQSGLTVIASGGTASLAEVARARAAGLGGLIIGRALYEKRIDLGEALRC
jgi:phosphoribosylformimino-5-aminoimidazole carboxamide ribotide isomerase